jgi:hypothetical protein
MTIDPNQPGIGRCTKTQCLEMKVLLLQLSLLVKPVTKPDAQFPTLEYVAAQCCARLALPPFRISGEGEEEDCMR